MSDLQSIIAFWHDCLKTENALEQSFQLKRSFELTSHTKAMIFDGEFDPFIFDYSNRPVPVVGEKMKALVSRSTLKGEDLYYGYPLLAYVEQSKLHVAPLFVIQIELNEGKLVSAEPNATLGSRALEELGLRQEQITVLNEEITNILYDAKPSVLEDVTAVLDRELTLNFSESINPKGLNRNDSVEKIQPSTIYNRAVLFTAEASPYNLHLLSDLEKLRHKFDLDQTALAYLTGTQATNYDESFIPILPFAYDPYQVKAIQAILANRHTVVSGPPGTGKSQFIANLIVNLSMQRKKVLLVSHTTDAVRVVNERIGQHFEYLIMQTGKKELRQTLVDQLDTMAKSHNMSHANTTGAVTIADVTAAWQEIISKSLYIKQTDELASKLSELQLRVTALMRNKGILSRIKKFMANLKTKQLLRTLEDRQTSLTLLEEIREAQNRHVEYSLEYVSDNYLRQMFGQGGYGELVAYMESVQSRKALYGRIEPAERYINSALESVNVWSCTLKSVGANFPLEAGLFDYVIFDEASQIDLPSAAPALYRAKNVVVVGDDRQLTHITKINEEVEESLAKVNGIFDQNYYPGLVSYRGMSLFSSAKHALQDTEQTLLNHYRSNYEIANLFNKVFYGGELNVFEPESHLPKEIKSGAFWIDVKGIAQKYASGSRYNEAEAREILSLLHKVLPQAIKNNLTIGITSPYSRQTNLIASMLQAEFHTEALKNVKVLTVHKFQGSEVDILFFSTVIAKQGSANSASWYKMNPEILNVAISRARQLLIIVGDRDYAKLSGSKLKEISETIATPFQDRTLTKPMNTFELSLYQKLQSFELHDAKIIPQFILDGRYTLDFAIIADDGRKFAVELDGYQHRIVGSMAIYEDSRRDTYLRASGWKVLRISVVDLFKEDHAIQISINELLK
jgi:very-short-patch-repair endonuclease/KaiC/GvpD/RAD55 family RecA-like ATPase